jgi:hypothetical protein
MKRVFLALLLLALPLAAQEEKKAEAKPIATVQKLFVLKYADPQSVRNLLQVFHASIDANRDMRVLAVDATPETMSAIEDAIKRLDVPSAAPTNIDLTVYMVVGHEAESSAGSVPVPKELESVVTQLKSAFAFKSYSLLDVLALRTRTGQEANSSSSGGALQAGVGGTHPVLTQLRLGSTSVDGDGPTIHINKLNANIRVPVSTGSGWEYQGLGLGADVDIKEGQKVVIGRLGISNDALFLVMTAKILQ